ncbi:MAG: hypothetical protein ACI9HK_002844 [Pirellulaceae bacterium]|jgi:hypothetical protein
MQDLQKQYLHRSNRVEHGINPSHTAIATSLLDLHGVDFFGPVLLELFDDLRNTAHVSLRCVWYLLTDNYSYARGPRFDFDSMLSQQCFIVGANGFTKMLMPLGSGLFVLLAAAILLVFVWATNFHLRRRKQHLALVFFPIPLFASSPLEEQ